jgi:hypothetical protein
MIKCETCIYRKNCQFLGKHKKAVVVDCEAYESEADLKTEVAKEIFNDLDEYLKTWRADNQRKIQYNQPEYYQGKIVAADEVAWFIRTELKKKYLEE